MKQLIILFFSISCLTYSQDKATSYLLDKVGDVSYNYYDPIEFEQNDDEVIIKGNNSLIKVDLNIELSKYNQFLGSVDCITLHNSDKSCALIIILKPYFINNTAFLFIQGFDYNVDKGELTPIVDHKEIIEFSMDEMVSDDFEFGSTFKIEKNKLYYVFFKKEERIEYEMNSDVWEW